MLGDCFHSLLAPLYSSVATYMGLAFILVVQLVLAVSLLALPACFPVDGLDWVE